MCLKVRCMQSNIQAPLEKLLKLMAIKISKQLISKLPITERDGIEATLLNKSGGQCFLCGMNLNEAGEDIVADHDQPEVEGGVTSISNLNLVHVSCNLFKNNHSTVNVRPYLKLTNQIKLRGGFLKYDEAVSLLGIQPKAIAITLSSSTVEITLPDGEKQSSPIYSEKNKEGEFSFCYVSLTTESIFNDSQCQPRTIKPLHLWQIYNDINHNPLHEAPACRIQSIAGTVNLYQALMFDGQHKTLSFWIAGRKSIVTKIYLNLTKDAAIRLVNSVQSKIKKLPLSPFELAAKMSEEWQERVSKYESEVGSENGSEDGFLKWVEKDERTRARSAFTDALLQNIIEKDDLQFKSLLIKQGQKPQQELSISESTFKNKILKSLLHTSPLKESFNTSQRLRDRETEAIVRLLNLLYSKIFKNGEQMSPQDEMKAKRITYQSSLVYICSIIRTIVGNKLYTVDDREFLEKDIDSETWAHIERGIDNILAHPVWVTPFDRSNKLRSVRDALTKNQDAKTAFGNVGLKPGYVGGLDKLPPNCLDD